LFVFAGEVLDSLLESMDLSKEDLPQSTQKGIGVLSSLALTLGVDRIEVGSLYPALESVLEEEEEVQSTSEEEKKRLEELTLSTASMLQSMNQLKKVLEDEEEERQLGRREIQRKRSEKGYMEGKAKEYRQTLVILKEELTKTGITPEITHQEALKLYERIQEIESELSPLESRLRVYQNLPPVCVKLMG
jgi:DNA repair exonuclease SbcCD ATPase subunit